MANRYKAHGEGAGTIMCLTIAIIFTVFKITRVIDWSWGWVLCPIWIPCALIILIVVVGAVSAVFNDQLWDDEEEQDD